MEELLQVKIIEKIPQNIPPLNLFSKDTGFSETLILAQIVANELEMIDFYTSDNSFIKLAL